MRLLEKVRGAPRRAAVAGVVLAGAVVLVGPTIASALPGGAGGQPPPGAPAVQVDPDSVAPVPAQPPAGAPAVKPGKGETAAVPAQPANTDPQRPTGKTVKPAPQVDGGTAVSGPDAGTGVSSPPE